MSRSLLIESHAAARDAIAFAFGCLPALLSPMTTGPMVREAQRHLAQFCLQPIAEIVAQECSEKLGGVVALDLITPLQAYDQGGRARAFATLIEGLTSANAAGLPGGMVKVAWQSIRGEPSTWTTRRNTRFLFLQSIARPRRTLTLAVPARAGL